MSEEQPEIPACADQCQAPNWSDVELQWCSFPVVQPFTDWETVKTSAKSSTDADSLVAKALSGIHVYLVEAPEDVGPALNALHQSMKDPIIGIDCEWKPDQKARENSVAMVQLASSSCAVLIRTCRLGGIPQEVIEFCKDDAIVGVGFNWDGSDELKMLDCFDMGRHDLFSHFLDLQTQAEIMGYHHCSLARLAELVLGFQPPSAKSVTMSNWEASYLTPRQVRYAALDALVTSDAFRGLRLLHAASSSCLGCLLPLGAWPGVLDLRCTHPECACKQPHNHILGLLQHMKSKQHDSNVTTCKECGRTSSKDSTVTLPGFLGYELAEQAAREQHGSCPDEIFTGYYEMEEPPERDQDGSFPEEPAQQPAPGHYGSYLDEAYAETGYDSSSMPAASHSVLPGMHGSASAAAGQAGRHMNHAEYDPNLHSGGGAYDEGVVNQLEQQQGFQPEADGHPRPREQQPRRQRRPNRNRDGKMYGAYSSFC